MIDIFYYTAVIFNFILSIILTYTYIRLREKENEVDEFLTQIVNEKIIPKVMEGAKCEVCAKLTNNFVTYTRNKEMHYLCPECIPQRDEEL